MIYISGPITGTDDYMERFAAAETELRENEYYGIINPTRYNAQLLSDYVTTYKDYIHVSLVLLDMCNTICMLDGWENSKGARLEHAYAEAMGKGIIYQTPPTEDNKEQKYHWRLSGKFESLSVYLNYSDKYNRICCADECNNDLYSTELSESEYKALAKEFHFPEDMFVKEEIE